MCVSQFLERAEGRCSITGEDCSEYVLESLQLCIRTCSILSEHLTNAVEQGWYFRLMTGGVSLVISRCAFSLAIINYSFNKAAGTEW